MLGRYILVNGEPELCEDLFAWAKWFEESGEARIVKQEDVGEAEVSTVFLGLDHSFGDGPSLLFETMIFGGREDGYQKRYSTREQAVAGHEKAVRLAELAAALDRSFFVRLRERVSRFMRQE